MSECQTTNCPTCGFQLNETFVEQKCPRCQALIDSKFVCGSCHNCGETIFHNQDKNQKSNHSMLDKVLSMFSKR